MALSDAMVAGFVATYISARFREEHKVKSDQSEYTRHMHELLDSIITGNYHDDELSLEQQELLAKRKRQLIEELAADDLEPPKVMNSHTVVSLLVELVTFLARSKFSGDEFRLMAFDLAIKATRASAELSATGIDVLRNDLSQTNWIARLALARHRKAIQALKQPAGDVPASVLELARRYLDLESDHRSQSESYRSKYEEYKENVQTIASIISITRAKDIREACRRIRMWSNKAYGKKRAH